MTEDFYGKLGEFLRDRLNNDEDPFAEDYYYDDGGDEIKIEKTRHAGNTVEKKAVPKKRIKLVPVPEELAEDFIILGLRPGEPLEECKTAWKNLLKKHHPDRNSGSAQVQAQASRTTINITRAYKRIAHWFETGKVPEL